jgi:hypothetical protein
MSLNFILFYFILKKFQTNTFGQLFKTKPQVLLLLFYFLKKFPNQLFENNY